MKKITMFAVVLLALCALSCGSPVFSKGGAQMLRTSDISVSPSTGYYYRGSTNGFWQTIYFGKKSNISLTYTLADVSDDALCFRIYGGGDLDYFSGYGTVQIENDGTCLLELLGGKQGDEDTYNTTGVALTPTTLTLAVFKDGEIVKLSGILGTESNKNYKRFKGNTFILYER